jgi:hypothetical protein
MIEAGAVGARFTVVDEASPVLRALMNRFLELQDVIDKAKLSLSSLRLPPGLGAGVGKLDESFTTLAGTADTTAAKIATGFGEIDSAIATTQRKVAMLREEMKGIGAPHAGGGGGGGWAGSGRGTGGGSRGHGGSAFHLGAHERFGPLAVRAVGDSSIPMAAGFAGLFAAYEAGKQAMDVAQANNNMSLMGASPEAIAKANAAAIGMSKYGMSQVEGLNSIRIASVPLNTGGTADTGLDAAGSVLPTIAKFDQLARSLHGENGGDATKQVFDLLKADELRNKLSPDEANKFIADYAQIYAGTGGKVDPRTFYQGLKYAKSSGIGFSDDFVKYTLPGIETEEGGSTAGTMLMTTASALLGRRLKKPPLPNSRAWGFTTQTTRLKTPTLR